MGGGKTLLTLSILDYRKKCGDRVKAIVFVPYITSVETWVEEVAKHVPTLRCVPLHGTGPDNFNALSQDADLFVVCYQTCVSMFSIKQKGDWILDKTLLNQHFREFKFVVFDEIHKCKSVSSLTYKLCRQLAYQCDYAIGLTGTPFARDMGDIWPQFNLIDFGETLGPTLSFFRAAFFDQKKNYWGGYEYKLKKKLLPTLHRFIKNKSIHYSVDEFADMPPKVYQQKHLTLPAAGRGYSDAAILQIREAIKQGSYRQVENSYLRLQQLGSGFMTLHGEDTDKVQIQFDENPKLDALEEILDAAPPEVQLVVFHHFIYTHTLISSFLNSRNVSYVCINSSVRDPISSLRRFKAGKARVLVINCKSGSSSLNLQNANYIVFFEQPTSAIDRQQAEARCWRPGQDKRVFIIDLLMKGTCDERQYETNKSGEDLLKCLMQGKTKL